MEKSELEPKHSNNVLMLTGSTCDIYKINKKHPMPKASFLAFFLSFPLLLIFLHHISISFLKVQASLPLFLIFHLQGKRWGKERVRVEKEEKEEEE
jgi:hypothetical protein